ncbi:probable transcriptional regulator [Halorhodospira halochloris]|uniref:Probable transcriptional regulator n=1 Tax=Halorhodospira halochloris TaxID=1052 RepID=A0A0X8X8F1_HALHR|nr:hypothetical protein [Halorhodospira halochloris]MBK1651199.1 hypothetical protein [Halorhodospira halochloris]MCG5547656.1 hypothetical protein [Halorhodospira halochloris]BAU57471.1 probable transcriptional regulator [Halorhodospira halochloris]
MAQQSDSEKFRQTFAKRLRQAINDFGYTGREQKALGELFGVTGQTVQKWLDGTAMPTRDKMPRLASILAVRRTWLEYGEGDKRPSYAISEQRGSAYKEDDIIELKESEINLLLAIRRLSQQDREALEHIIMSWSGLSTG